ncbi:AAA family ATPase [Pontiella sulfatireligans]|uniref:Nuclease SbcCD subunit C n=1 Tax=Pontiella sulfatireligans TaxID=2750658 RepID=A0A6C2UR11_9BACT|nr:SbcC/MukB-like Walker B domain-containing protein [Pontiella sulfatireligans]VGO22539.1 Nuclease SbcCD subunit C [Pontiella sulfatireligans]
MKILELRFKNLNSLYGEWCIDFTHPDFEANGLFAITGATGSGKTTILDALCLALYGQTPRLGKMTQSDNEVMSRQTGECFAEVLFETAKGTYRASWHQHRARKKAGAPLQSPKRELADAAGTILAEKLKEVQEKIDDVVGMGFDRFTRSILLAQGSFDSFLKADADERSPILEQITGTEIYTEISKLVHQRNSAENQKLNELKAGLDGIQMLGTDEREQIAFDLKQIEEKHKAEAEKRDAAKAALDCLKRIETLTNELEANRAEQETLRGDNEAFKPEAARLATAKRAQPLTVAHAKLVNFRNDLSKTAIELKAATDALPSLEKQQTKAAALFKVAVKLLNEKEAAQQELAPVLKQARALDTQIIGRLAIQKTENAALEQLKGEQKALRETEAENKAALEQLQARQTEAEIYQKEHAHDAGLVGQLAAILQSLEHLGKLSGEKDKAQKTAKQTATAATQATKTAAEEENNLAVVQKAFSKAETASREINREVETLLEGKPLPDWRTRHEELRLRINIEQRILVTRGAIEEKTAAVSGAEKELILKRSEQEGLQREQALVAENLKLQQKVESLEAEREALADGQPCPLCGALEHPYAAGLPARETSSLEKINAALSALANQINTLTEKQAGANADCKTLQTSLKKDEAELETLAPGSAEEAEQIASRIGQIEKLERADKEAKTALDHAREALNRQMLATQSAKQNVKTATEKAEETEAQRIKAETMLAGAESQLQQKIEPFGIPLSPETSSNLTVRRDQWIEAEEQAGKLKQTISNLQTTRASQAEQIGLQETRIRKQAEMLTVTGSLVVDLKAQRINLFGDRDPDAAEQEAQTVLDASRKEAAAAQTQLGESKQALMLARQNAQTLEKGKQEIQAQLVEAGPSFAAALTGAGFENEAAYLGARLDETEQSKLEARADELKHRHTHLAALEAEKAQQLQAEREQKHVESSPEEHALLVQSCEELLKEIGTLNNQLEQNRKATELHQSKLGEIEKQQIECNRWSTLHELIGSADGKKFRNFAQGLTFELMVSHANQQLSKMSDRYLLVRDKRQPLDLNVVDNYQAGEIRPVKNLSGGESFIVSLSLALGLSRMASKHIRVDSLFLDEGFGTLDEDALETALEALAELKQAGKLIGVISHVGALKERISTQINVHIASGGRNRLSGTGISSTKEKNHAKDDMGAVAH